MLRVSSHLRPLTPTITIGDVVQRSVRLALPTGVGCTGSILTAVVERACKEGAAVLSIDIVVGVHESTFWDAIAHDLTVMNRVDQTKSQVPIAVDCPTQPIERRVVHTRFRWGGRYLGGLVVGSANWGRDTDVGDASVKDSSGL